MRTPVFNDRHYRLIAEAIRYAIEEVAERRKISRRDLDDEAATVLDALSGLFTVDDPQFSWIDFQFALGIEGGPTSSGAVYRAQRLLAINGIGE